MKSIKNIRAIKPQRRNANRHSQRGMGQLERSVQSDGWIGAITVAADGETFDGSARVEVASAVGFDDVIVVESDGTRPIVHVRTDIPTADDPRAARLGIAANRIAQTNLEWDTEVLAALAEDGVDLAAFWQDDELDELLGSLANDAPKDDPGAQVDRAEELREKWQTERGQLWQIGRHRLLCGDSTNADDVARLIEGATPQTLIFDPPWDAGINPPDGAWESTLAFCDGRRAGDIVRLFGAPAWVFGWDCVTTWYTPHRPLQQMKLCFWYGDVSRYDMDGAHYGEAATGETAMVTRWGPHVYRPDPRGLHLRDLYRESIATLHADALHKHLKPADWVRCMIANCTSGDVFDPFGGSGTSIIACEQVGNRTCLAMEIDPAMVAVTLERLAGLDLQPERVG